MDNEPKYKVGDVIVTEAHLFEGEEMKACVGIVNKVGQHRGKYYYDSIIDEYGEKRKCPYYIDIMPFDEYINELKETKAELQDIYKNNKL